ncbi:MAG: hypothetical protein IPJ19_03535 [Planctomycetes bacterium]|nr:hypothetical protein [Planctomycetota bacterium]
MNRKLLFILPVLLAAPVRAQGSYGPSGVTAFGEEVAILSDVDGLGRRDFLVSAPPPTGATTLSSGAVYVISAESAGPFGNVLATVTPFQAGIPNLGAEFGRALANVGDVDGVPGDEFAIATPRLTNSPGLRGEVEIFTLQPSGGGVVPVYVRSLYSSFPALNDYSFGSSMAVLTGQNTANGRALAIGIPGLNRVDIFDPNTGVRMRSLDVQTPTGSIGGNLGFSLAAGPDNVLAAGAPDYRPPNAAANQFRYGYVAVYDLNSASSFPRSFLYRGIAFEAIGRAMASVGQLPGNPGSTLSDFAVLGSGSTTVQSKVYLFHTPPAQMTGPTPTTAVANLTTGLITLASDGRMAALNDIDGDGVGDFAVTANGFLNVLSTHGNSLTPTMSPVAASTNSGLSSGPDLLGVGGTDLIIGTPNLTASSGGVRVLSLATSVRLPNPPGVSLDVSLARPLLGASYPLTVTGTPGNAVALLVNLAPFTPVPFGGGSSLAYLSTTGAVTVGIAASPSTFTVSIPLANQNLGQAFLFQAVQFETNGSLTLSNGILARLGLQ